MGKRDGGGSDMQATSATAACSRARGTPRVYALLEQLIILLRQHLLARFQLDLQHSPRLMQGAVLGLGLVQLRKQFVMLSQPQDVSPSSALACARHSRCKVVAKAGRRGRRRADADAVDAVATPRCYTRSTLC